MITTAIFDLDGLLADTERLHRRAYQDVLAARGTPLSDSFYAEHWIRDGKGIQEFLQQRGLAFDVDEIRRAKARRYEELVRASASAMPGAVALLESLGGHKTLALATSSYHEAAAVVLETLGITDHFALVAAKEDAPRAKPHPDLFLFVARRLEVPPDACLVLEDAEKGIRAARAAGMRCIAVPNEFTRGNDFSEATLVLASLNDLSRALIDSLG